MERPRYHLTLALLLLGLLAGAVATIGVDAQPCEFTHLATQIARFCATGLPTPRCCEPFVASVDRGGGVPCLCRVAAQPQGTFVSINASNLLSLYIACGGLNTDGAHFATACLGSPPPSAIAPPPAVPLLEQQSRSPPFTIPVNASPPAVPLGEQQLPGTPPSDVPSIITASAVIPLHRQQTRTSCDWTELAFELTQYCHDDMGIPDPRCCRSVLLTIDNQDPYCLCRVVEAGDMVVSGFLDVLVMWDFYQECGGRKQTVPKDKENCSHAPSPPPPPPPSQPPPPPPTPPKTNHRLPGWLIAVIVVVCVVVVVPILAGVAGLIWKQVKAKRQARQEEFEKEQALQLALQQEEEARQLAREEEQARQLAREQKQERQVQREVEEYEALQRTIARTRELERASRHSPEKQKIRVQYSSDYGCGREAQYN